MFIKSCFSGHYATPIAAPLLFKTIYLFKFKFLNYIVFVHLPVYETFGAFTRFKRI